MIKKFMFKKVTTYLMLIAMAGTLLFTGCSSDTSSSSSNTSTTEETEASVDSPDGTPPDGEGGFDVESGSSVETTGVLSVDGTQESKDGEEITATKENESCVKATNAANLTLTNAVLNKESGEMTVEEASDFFGANAAVLANEGSTVTLDKATITTSTSGGNAVFSTGEGSVVNISNSTITTTGDHARGLDATYTGTINADNVTINTAGAHCAAAATDRGEGTVNVTDSTLNTSGTGSPCIYSTGDITVTNSEGTAEGSSLTVVEGMNAASVINSTLKGAAIGRTTEGIDSVGVMVYQSMSGDADSGVGSFSAEDSTLEILEDSSVYSTAPMFFVTNTDAEIDLTNTDLVFGSGILLKVAGNDGEWGTEGENGGNLTFSAKDQTLEGDIYVDDISTLTLALESSSLTGSINEENTAKEVIVSLDKESKWNVTGTSYVTAITDEDESLSNIISNGNTIYYDSSNSTNSWLNGETVTLSDGGSLTPMR